MFAHLKKHRVILVTGPHRSGTTIAARMIAADTGHDFVIEDEIGFSKVNLLALFIQSDYGPLVVQCPFLCNHIGELEFSIGLDYSEVCVVMLHRYVKDIIASEEKVLHVNFDALGLAQKRSIGDKSERHVSDMKYANWDRQRKRIKHTFDLGYESLRDHPMWLEDRTSLTFQHQVRRHRHKLPMGFRDGLLALQNN